VGLYLSNASRRRSNLTLWADTAGWSGSAAAMVAGAGMIMMGAKAIMVNTEQGYDTDLPNPPP